jgi:hypothetical protein
MTKDEHVRLLRAISWRAFWTAAAEVREGVVRPEVIASRGLVKPQNRAERQALHALYLRSLQPAPLPQRK